MLPTTNIPTASPAEQVPTPVTASIDPPPYEDASDTDSDNDDLPFFRRPVEHNPLTLKINAASSVHGLNNLFQTPPPPYAEIAKMSTFILETLNELAQARGGKRQRLLKVGLTINCGLTVIGNRNVVGGIGLRPKGSLIPIPGSENAVTDAPIAVIATGAGDATGGGAKRKAEDSPEDESEPAAKRVAVESQT